MLFQVVTRNNPVGISGDEFMKRLPEGFAYMRKLVQQGVIQHSWVRVGENGGLNIFSVNSHEELLKYLYGNPISAHLTFTITPLVSFEAFTTDDIRDFWRL